MLTHVDVGAERINRCADSISVFWHDVMSPTFKTSNVVEQGGILSPFIDLYLLKIFRVHDQSVNRLFKGTPGHAK